jgi:hypothetical protein
MDRASSYNKNAVFMLLLFLLILAFLIGGFYYASLASSSDDILTAKKLNSSSRKIRKAYQIALTKRRAFEKIPCYCNCFDKHKSLKDCFIKKVDKSGKVTYDKHGSSCTTCVDEAFMVHKLLSKGFPLKKTRHLIDKKFKDYGIPTKTPF